MKDFPAKRILLNTYLIYKFINSENVNGACHFDAIISCIERDICVALCSAERAETREHLEERLGWSAQLFVRQRET